MIDEKKIWEMAGDVFDANNYIYDFSEVAEYDWETPLWDEEQMKDAIEKGIRCGIQEFVKSYTFADGSVFGVKEEEA